MRKPSIWAGLILLQILVGACSPTFNPSQPLSGQLQISPTPTGTLGPSGFTLSKTQSASNLNAGQTIVYYLFYSEPIASVAPNLAIWDTVPTGVQFLQVLSGPGNPPQFTQTGNVLAWGYPGPVTGLSGAITWLGTVSCASGAITNIASLQTQNSSVTDSNRVVAFVACATNTPTPTSTLNLTPIVPTSSIPTYSPTFTWTFPVTWTMTATPTLTGSNTPSPSRTPSPTGTTPVTWTATQTPTPTIYNTLTGTPTLTNSPTSTSTRTSTITRTFTPTQTPFVTCTAPVTWGDWNWTASPVTILYGTSCQQYVLTKATQVNSIDFLADSHGLTGNMSVGIYADGGGYPGALIWNSGNQSFNLSGSVIGFTVPSLNLAAGTYWLAVVGDGSTTLEKAVGSTSTRYWRSGVVFPNPFMSPGGPLPTPVNTPPPSSTTDIADLWSLSCQ